MPHVTDDDRARWDAKYRERGAPSWEPCPFLLRVAEQLPAPGRALDLAGGVGRHALWLAARAWEVTLADVSPVALALALSKALERELRVETAQVDLTRDPPPRGPWQLIVVHHYLQRELFPLLPDLLEPGGAFLFVQPTTRNLERHAHPSARFLLEEGELASLIPPGLDPLVLEEGWDADRHEARLLAERVS